MRTYRSLVSGSAALLGVAWSCLAFSQEHFNPAGAGASEHTRALQAALRDSLPFEDERDFEEHVTDGVRIVFQNTPGTEAPAEMNAWFPEQRVFWAAENISATVHSVYTLRGAQPCNGPGKSARRCTASAAKRKS